MYRQVERGSGRTGLDTGTTEPRPHVPEFLELLPGPYGGPSRPRGMLYGRDRDLAELISLLTDPAERLITVTGPGGVGKTRLALEAAHRAEGIFVDGLVIVSLAPVRDPELVVPTIGQAIGLHRSDTAPMLMRIIGALHEQRVLLLLDNFEHVAEAGLDIARLLHACPRVTILATSRIPLHLQDERLFPVAPLAVEPSPTSGESELPGGVRLFLDRARQRDPSLIQNQSLVLDVQEICRQLDGLPLAIELAAAHIGTISPRELKQRLNPRLSLLSHGYRDLPERQRTMRATIAWSYELLSEWQRHAFQWLSVFVGGFRLHTAEALLTDRDAGDSAARNGEPFIETIGALVASNLLHRSPGAGNDDRYAMLEIVREFGIELLREHGELEQAHRAHASWYASNREWLDPNRFDSNESFIAHLWDIDAEYPNLLAALNRSAAMDDYQTVLDIAGNAATFWHHRGLLNEGRTWLQMGLERAPDAPPRSRGWALAGLGMVQWTQGDGPAAEPVLLEALSIAERIGEIELRALSLHMLALIDADAGKHERSIERIELALSIWRELRLPSDAAMALMIRSGFAPLPGERDLRERYVLEALDIFEEIGHRSGSGFCLLRLGRLWLDSGDERKAFDFFARAASAFLEIDERWAIARSLAYLSHLALQHRLTTEAATLIGVMDERLGRAGAQLALGFRPIAEETRARLEASMSRHAFGSATAAGARASVADIESLIASIQAAIFAREQLTQRERDVLELIAMGATDREIADALFISPRTVHTHVGHILTKLDVSSRRDAVRRARELRLIATNTSP
ncbi:MAG: LuxR C-terminal-related transcriptional regulator [Thermomicrobiales bacterium]